MSTPGTILVLGSLLLTAGCTQRTLTAKSRTHESSTIFTVNERNANQSIRLHTGDKLVVSLSLQNGGQWQLLQSVAPTLLTQYTPAKVSAYEGHIFSSNTLSNGYPSSYVFIANAAGTELLQLVASRATRYTGIGNTYNLRVEVTTNSDTAKQ